MVHCHTSSKEKYTHTTDKWINIPGAWPAIPTQRRQDCVDQMIVLSIMNSQCIQQSLVNTKWKRKADRVSRCSDYRDQLNIQFVILKINSFSIQTDKKSYSITSFVRWQNYNSSYRHKIYQEKRVIKRNFIKRNSIERNDLAEVLL